ncbi:MAG: FliM/FliN family flagellar motor C-terminal domain-containing protein [Rhodobacteraceae bacterium]|nr:FliM/FliN family flagellar motor C-terminal domain-containing protein [Paracoccaceae bacterium]
MAGDVGAVSDQHVIGRKAAAARRALEARSMSPSRALRRALSWVADELWGLALVCQGIQTEVVDQDAAPETLGARQVLIVLDGPDGGVGLAALDPALLAGLVELQTLGVVLKTPAPDRVFTPTDAAMAAALIDAGMTRFATNLDGHPLADQLSGFRFGAMIEDPRAASLVLDAAEYRVFSVTIDLAHGAKQGELQFLLPVREVPDAHDSGNQDQPGPHEQTLLLVPAQINAILARVQMPLARAGSLAPGDLVPLPAEAVSQMQIMVGQNEMLAKASLGQMNGFRAVRLDLPDRAKAMLTGAGPDAVASGPAPGPEKPTRPGATEPEAARQEVGVHNSTLSLQDAEFDASSVDLPELDIEPLDPLALPALPD